jgi:protein SCO1/2
VSGRAGAAPRGRGDLPRRLLGAGLLTLAAAALAQAPPPGLEGVGIEPRLGAAVPADLPFRDEGGREVSLGNYLGERPVVLALVYYECPMLCGLVLNGLSSSLGVLAFDAGDEFEVVAVSIDPGETPALAAAKKASCVGRYGRPGTAGGWHFLTGGEASIAALAEAVGFRYRYDPAIDQYAHAAGILVLTPEGKLARYLAGVDYPPKDLRLAIVEASAGRVGTFADQVLLYCYRYDPAAGGYGLAITRAVRLGGILTVLGLAGLVAGMRLRERRAARRTAA